MQTGAGAFRTSTDGSQSAVIGGGGLPGVLSFIKQLEQECQRRLPDFEPQQLANTAWAFARLEVLGNLRDPLLALIAQRVLNVLDAPLILAAARRRQRHRRRGLAGRNFARLVEGKRHGRSTERAACGSKPAAEMSPLHAPSVHARSERRSGRQ